MTMTIEEKIQEADAILDAAIKEHEPSHVFGLFSGGHDSLCATHVVSRHPAFTGAFHINTGIGIEETREFVRETCKEHDWELIEYHPDGKTYEELIAEMGFPHGPKSHNSMYYWLKQRQMRRLVKNHKTHWFDRIGLIAGIRLSESVRRMGKGISVEVRRKGAQLWINPILHFTKIDVNHYIDYFGLQRNPVVDILHKSGECLCGAFASRDELPEIEDWFPDAADEIKRLEQMALKKGLVDHRWTCDSIAPGKTYDEIDEQDMAMCQSCEFRATIDD